MAKTGVRWCFNWSEWRPSEADFKLAIACLQKDEKERLARFVFKKDVKSSLIGRLMMRKFINETAEIPYDQIQLIRDDHNRPILKNTASASVPVSFNVSHQGDYTILAGEIGNIKIGADIMKLEYTGGKPLNEFFRIMNRNFSSAEWREINGDADTDERKKIAMFCRHWALKESYVKALSVGITVDLRELDFRTNSELFEDEVVSDTVLLKDGVEEKWRFEETLINGDHCVAVAMEMKELKSLGDNYRWKNMDFEGLMEGAVPLAPEDDEYCREFFEKEETPFS